MHPLSVCSLKSHKDTQQKSGRNPYENITVSGDSYSLPSSQNTARWGFHMKNRGRIGKKKPKTIPWMTDELEEEGWDTGAVPGLSRESIHCSSRARACSSSETDIKSLTFTPSEMRAYILPLC